MNKLTELVKELNDVRSEKDMLEKRLTEVNKRKIELETKEIPQIMEDAEQSKVKIDGVGTIYLKADLYCHPEGDIIEWLKENGHGSIVKETVHHGTLRSWANEQLDTGGTLPPNLKVQQFMKATLRRV